MTQNESMCQLVINLVTWHFDLKRRIFCQRQKNHVQRLKKMILVLMYERMTWVATQVVTPVRRDAMARHSSTTPDLVALLIHCRERFSPRSLITQWWRWWQGSPPEEKMREAKQKCVHLSVASLSRLFKLFKLLPPCRDCLNWIKLDRASFVKFVKNRENPFYTLNICSIVTQHLWVMEC